MKEKLERADRRIAELEEELKRVNKQNDEWAESFNKEMITWTRQAKFWEDMTERVIYLLKIDYVVNLHIPRCPLCKAGPDVCIKAATLIKNYEEGQDEILRENGELGDDGNNYKLSVEDFLPHGQ